MSTATNAANAIQNLIYRAVAWADMAENDATGPATTIDIALHVGAPVTSSQSSNEVTVGQWDTYARKSITRNTSEWDAAVNGMIQNTNLAQFVEMVSGTGCTITHVSTGYNGNIIHYGGLTASRTVSAGIQPQFAGNALKSTMS
jgi:hypothetical protein